MDVYLAASDLGRLYNTPVGTIYRWASEDHWRRTRTRPIRYHASDMDTSYRKRRDRCARMQPMVINEPVQDVKLLRIDEVAAILRVSKMTVYRMVDDGDLEAIPAGKRLIRIPESAVIRLLAGRIRPSAPA